VFCANFEPSQGGAHVTLSINGVSQGDFEIDETAYRCIDLAVAEIRQPEITFSVASNASIQLDDLRLFGFVQRMNIYDENGQPGSLRDLIVRMNTDWLAD
jgi:hypothetical protein